MSYKYRLYNGLAGDSSLLLTVYKGNNNESELFNRMLPFYNFRLKRKIIKLINRLEIINKINLKIKNN